jgi:N-carbamoylputrescine amidase
MIKIALLQFQMSTEKEFNVAKAEKMLHEAGQQGAKVACLPELFSTWYFAIGQTKHEYYRLAETIPGPTIDRIAAIAKQYAMVVIAPIYETDLAGRYYNAAAVINSDGKLLGKYRKNSIPCTTFPDYSSNEKFYFAPGNLGFPVFDTALGLKLGILVCYDRHFPEHGRLVALKGAHIIFFPSVTAGFTRYLWELEIRAQAAMNVVYVAAVNRVGRDIGGAEQSYYGDSMVVDPGGNIIARADDHSESVLYADIDPSALVGLRDTWGFYRDRRPDLYGELSTL